MQFSYVAYTLGQGVVKGRLEARDATEARAELVQQGFKPLRLGPAWQAPSLEALFPSLVKVRGGEVVRLARQMATMLDSGAGLLRTLQMLQAEAGSRAMRRILGAIYKNLDEGGSLSEAMAQHPKVFDSLFISVVEVGEHTGRLGKSLNQMATILEKEQETRQKAMQTLMYPMAIMVLSVLTLLVLMTVALPPLLEVFKHMDSEIPLMTRVAMGLFTGVKVHFLKVPLVILGVVVALKLLRRSRGFKEWMDSVQVRAPIVGSLIVTGELGRFTSTLAMLLEAGVPLATALQLGLASCKNLMFRRAFADAEESLLSGGGLAEALKRHPILPGMFVQLVAIGEESNSLRQTMADAAESYQKQHERRLTGILGMLEPASTVIVGGIVGFIAMSMFLPIYSGISAIGKAG